jgi:RNA polymerase sigma-70 factor (ECF subfamily)
MSAPLDRQVPPTASELPGLTSLTLLARVKDRDPQAWQRLLHLYGPLVFHWCRRWRLSSEDAADVSQEVFQALATHIDRFERDGPGQSFRGWLWTIARNKMLDHFRRAQRQPNAAGGSAAQFMLQSVPEQLPQDDDEAASSTGLVHRALDLIRGEFEERTWQMFWRSTVAGQAPRDIGAEMGVSADAVRMAKSRVLRRLRQELADWPE